MNADSPGVFWGTSERMVSWEGMERPQGGRGGGTNSLSLGTNCTATAPLLWQRTAPGFANLQPPLFMDTQEQPLEIIASWDFSVSDISNFNKLSY